MGELLPYSAAAAVRRGVLVFAAAILCDGTRIGGEVGCGDVSPMANVCGDANGQFVSAGADTARGSQRRLEPVSLDA
jgi:hypothetical protein